MHKSTERERKKVLNQVRAFTAYKYVFALLIVLLYAVFGVVLRGQVKTVEALLTFLKNPISIIEMTLAVSSIVFLFYVFEMMIAYIIEIAGHRSYVESILSTFPLVFVSVDRDLRVTRYTPLIGGFGDYHLPVKFNEISQGKEFLSFFQQDEAAQIRDTFAKLDSLPYGETVIGEGDWLTEKGYCKYRFFSRALTDSLGRLAGYIFVAEDVCEEDLLKKSLQEGNQILALLQERYHSIFRQAKSAVLLLSPGDWTIEEANDNFLATTGLRMSEVEGKSLWDFLGQGGKEALLALTDEEIERGSKELQIEFRGRSGASRSYDARVRKIAVEDKTLLVLTGEDVTETIQLRKEGEQRSRTIESINRLSKFVGQSFELRTVTDLIVNEARLMGLCDALYVVLFGKHPGEAEIIDGFSYSGIFIQKGEQLSLPEESLAWEATRGATLNAPALKRQRKEQLSGLEFLEVYSSALIIPVRRSLKCYGLLVLASRFENGFDHLTEAYYEQVGELLANTLSNIEILGREKRETTLHKLQNVLSERLTATLDPATIIWEAVGFLAREFGYERVAVCAKTASGRRYLCWNLSVTEGQEVREEVETEGLEGIVDLSIRSGKSIVSNFSPERASSEGSSPLSELAIPIILGKEIIGSLLIQDRKGDHFDEGQVTRLESITLLVANAFSNARLYKDAKEKSRELEQKRKIIEFDLTLASKIQRHLVPDYFLHRELEVSVNYLPAHKLGGDYVYLREVEDRVYVIIGDVTGHGVAAALVVNSLHGQVERMASKRMDPPTIAERLNNQILSTFTETGIFFTCFIGVIDVTTMEMDYVNNGHPSPLLFNEALGTFSYLEPNNLPLGIVREEFTKYNSVRRVLIEEEVHLILYTDGITDSVVNAERLGEEGLKRLYLDSDVTHPNARAEKVIDAVKGSGPEELSDDKLLLVIARRHTFEIYEVFSRLEDADAVTRKILFIARLLHHEESAIHFLKFTLMELMTNAIRHGNRDDPQKIARIYGKLGTEGWGLTIEDQGSGFDHELFLSREARVDEPGKYLKGLHMVRRLVDEMQFEKGGSSITVRKAFAPAHVQYV